MTPFHLDSGVLALIGLAVSCLAFGLIGAPSTKHLLGSDAYAASGSMSVKLAGLPDFVPGGLAYLDGIWVDINCTDIDNAGGTGASIDLHNTIATMTVTDGSAPWGPQELSGELIAESRYLARPYVIPYQGNTAGDSDVGAGTNSTRRFAVFYDYRAYGGSLYDYTPACRALKNGQVRITFSALPTNVTNLVYTATVYALCHGEKKLRAVPRIRTYSEVIPSLNYTVGDAGAFLQHGLRNAAAWAAADITAVSARVGGLQVLEQVDPFGVWTLEGYSAAGVTAADIQNHFCDQIGGAYNRALDLFGGAGVPVSNRPIGQTAKVDLTGAETAANIRHLTTLAQFMEPEFAAKQIAACGCKSKDVTAAIGERASKVVQDVTKNGKPLRDPRLRGYLPVEVIDQDLLAEIGLG